MMQDNVDNISPEECKAILKGLVAIRMEAECFDYDKLWKNPAHKTDYKQLSVASKYGYDSWNFLRDHGAITYTAGKQQKLTDFI